jgi:ubiquitin thioesterase OTU1
LFLCFLGKVDVDNAPFMRQIIAESVSNDPDNYYEAILGKPNPEYCQWILKPDSWGGAIELAVLSNFYGLEIAVVDTLNAIINRFGEDQHYAQRVFLMFDGIHYDPLYLEPFEVHRIKIPSW